MAASPGGVERQGALRGDLFRLGAGGRHDATMTHGPYGRNMHWLELDHDAYDLLDERGPYRVGDRVHGRSGR